MNARFAAALHCFSILSLALLVSSGCGCSNGDSGNGSGNGGGTPAGPVIREPDLELLADYGPPLQGLVEVAPPKGWRPMSRDSEFLIRYTGSSAGNNPLPLIRITVAESTFGEPNLTEENLSEFVAHLETELIETDKVKSFSEQPAEMIIGGRPCVRYVVGKRVRFRTINDLPVESQVLVTVFNRKQYDVELQVRKGQISASRDQAYAVFAGIQFLEEPSSTTPGEDPKGDDSTVGSEAVDEAKPSEEEKQE